MLPFAIFNVFSFFFSNKFYNIHSTIAYVDDIFLFYIEIKLYFYFILEKKKNKIKKWACVYRKIILILQQSDKEKIKTPQQISPHRNKVKPIKIRRLFLNSFV